jgi:cation:H+ antiporter
MIAATLVFIALAHRGQFAWPQGIILLAGLALMLGSAFREAQKHRREVKAQLAAEHAAKGEAVDPDLLEAEAAAEEEGEVEGVDPDMAWWKVLLFLALGLIGLPLGADILVDSSTIIARHYGVSETVIGLTLVAIGTSLPELATTVMAAYRNQAEVALGNVIGSNMFNLLAIIGVASLVGPIPVDPKLLMYDLWVMLAASVLIAPFVFRGWRMGRVWGIVFAALYALYLMAILHH